MKKRNSSIELLKIITIFLIVISHVAYTFGGKHILLGLSNEYFINLDHSTKNISYLLITIMKYFGSIGNDLFFIASAWFLADKSNVDNKKIFRMILDVWIVSMIILVIFKICNVVIDGSCIIKSILPILTCANWYVSAYLIIYFLSPKLNLIIIHISKREYLSMILVLIFLYFIVCALSNDFLFYNNFLIFVILYLVVLYIKKYCGNYVNNTSLNLKILFLSVSILLILILSLNAVGLKVTKLSYQLLKFDKLSNPFVLMIAMSSFNIFKSKSFVNDGINKWSSLTLLIYIIHENILVRTYLRPYIFVWIKDNFGYNCIVFWILLYALVLFLASSFIALIYSLTIQKITKKLSIYISNAYEKYSDKLLNKLLKIN